MSLLVLGMKIYPFIPIFSSSSSIHTISMIFSCRIIDKDLTLVNMFYDPREKNEQLFNIGADICSLFELTNVHPRT